MTFGDIQIGTSFYWNGCYCIKDSKYKAIVFRGAFCSFTRTFELNEEVF